MPSLLGRVKKKGNGSLCFTFFTDDEEKYTLWGKISDLSDVRESEGARVLAGIGAVSSCYIREIDRVSVRELWHIPATYERE